MLVAGIDSSTQSTKVVLCDADDGTVVGTGSAPHPPGTEVEPLVWWDALQRAGGGLLGRAAGVLAGSPAPSAEAGPEVPGFYWGAAEAQVADVIGPAFTDGTAGDVDLSAERWTGVLAPLNDPAYFAQVTVDPEAGTVVWPDGIDLAPEPLYQQAKAHPLLAA